MKEARDADTATFGELHYLWPQHPVLGWLRQRVQDAFGRHTAPVMRLPAKLTADEHWFLAHGGFPNRRGQALIQDQVAVQFVNDRVTDLLPLADCLQRLGLNGAELPNRAEPQSCDNLTLYLDDVVTHLRQYLKDKRSGINAELQAQVNTELGTLEQLKSRHVEQLTLTLAHSSQTETCKQQRLTQQRQQVESHFSDYERWLRDSVTTEDEPYIQIVAVITGSEGERLA